MITGVSMKYEQWQVQLIHHCNLNVTLHCWLPLRIKLALFGLQHQSVVNYCMANLCVSHMPSCRTVWKRPALICPFFANSDILPFRSDLSAHNEDMIVQVPQLTWGIIAAEVEFRLLGPRLGDWLALGFGYGLIAFALVNAGFTALAWQVCCVPQTSVLLGVDSWMYLPSVAPRLCLSNFIMQLCLQTEECFCQLQDFGKESSSAAPPGHWASWLFHVILQCPFLCQLTGGHRDLDKALFSIAVIGFGAKKRHGIAPGQCIAFTGQISMCPVSSALRSGRA